MKKSIRLLALAMVTVMLCLTLASCGGPNADPDKAVDALKENGVTWAGKDAVIIPGALKIMGVEGVDTVVSGTGKIEDEYAHITIIYFEDSASAKDAWEDVQEFADGKKNKDAKDWVCKKSGKMIYFGTKAAIAAAK